MAEQTKYKNEEEEYIPDVSYDKIVVEITCSSKYCEALREQGMFFSTIAEALEINRVDIRQI